MRSVMLSQSTNVRRLVAWTTRAISGSGIRRTIKAAAGQDLRARKTFLIRIGFRLDVLRLQLLLVLPLLNLLAPTARSLVLRVTMTLLGEP